MTEKHKMHGILMCENKADRVCASKSVTIHVMHLFI